MNEEKEEEEEKEEKEELQLAKKEGCVNERDKRTLKDEI